MLFLTSLAFRGKDNWKADWIRLIRSLLKQSACLNGVMQLPIILIVLKHWKRFWIAFFSQVILKLLFIVVKIYFPAYFEGFNFLCELWNSTV